MASFKDIKSAKAWDEFVAADQSANFLQASDWSRMKLKHKPVIARTCSLDGQLVASYTGLIEPARRARHLTIAGGPILDWSNKKLVQATFADIAKVAREQNCVFVRIRPQLELGPKSRQLFKELGLRPSPMHLSVEHAGLLDLGRSDELIWDNMSQSLRRKIRFAQTQKIKMTTSSKMSTAKEFCRLHRQHAARQNYVPFRSEFLLEQFRVFADSDRVKIYSAHHGQELLAMNMMFFYGQEVSYHYAISTQAGSKLSAAPSLHLAAIKEARKRGISRYNFWGIVPKDQTNHRFYGVSQFKRSFGVSDFHYLPAHDLVLKPTAYSLNWLLETVRRHRRKLMR